MDFFSNMKSLLQAAASGDSEALEEHMRFFTGQGADEDPLLQALERGDATVPEIKGLLATTTDINAFHKGAYNMERTALGVAAASGRADLVDLLVQHGAAVNQKRAYGLTAIFDACEAREPLEVI